MDPVISVRNISKRYRIGQVESRKETFAEQVTDFIASPFRNFARLRRLSSFDREDDSVFWALNDISFEVKEGEALGIIGHNGAGKSTLLKILSRITEPTSGEIRIKGRVSSLLEVGTGFHPELTGRENIYMNGTILGMRKREIDAKLDQIVEFSGVGKYLDTPVKRYSSGMKVRLAFSVAAHLEPDVLIVDEVLAVGDMEFQSKCLRKMDEVTGQGRTVLFVSHNLAAVNSLCTRGIVLRRGRKVFEGSQSEAVLVYRRASLAESSEDYVRPNPESIPVISRIRVCEYAEIAEEDCIGGESDGTNSVAVGSHASIIVDLDPKGKVYENCTLSLGIFTNDDMLVVAFKSKVQVNRKWNLREPGRVVIYWKSVNLTPGEYFIKCAFGSEHSMIDDISFGGRLSVILDTDVFGSGNSSRQIQGLIVPSVVWSIP